MKYILFIGGFFSWLFGVTANHNHIISQSDIYYNTKGVVHYINHQKGYFHHDDDSPNDLDNLVFYPDGTFLCNVCIQQSNDGKKEYIYPCYGVYKIDKDTIRANYYEVYSYLKVWYLTKIKYLLLDSNRIMCVSEEFISPRKKYPNDIIFANINKVYTFIPDSCLPNPDSPWKKYDWLWEDKNQRIIEGTDKLSSLHIKKQNEN